MAKKQKIKANIRGKKIHRADCHYALKLQPEYCKSFYTLCEAQKEFPDFSCCKHCRPEQEGTK